MKLCHISKFYSKYRDIISFNKNIVIAAIINAIANVFIVNYISIIYVTNYLIISIISIIADFLIYNISFVILYLIDNRSKYINPLDGSKNNQKIKQDLKKLVTIIGFAEISYLATKFFSTFIFFQSFSLDPSLISIITTVVAWIFYLLIVNIMARNQKLIS